MVLLARKATKGPKGSRGLPVLKVSRVSVGHLGRKVPRVQRVRKVPRVSLVRQDLLAPQVRPAHKVCQAAPSLGISDRSMTPPLRRATAVIPLQ
jgi:hypothetical protein